MGSSIASDSFPIMRISSVIIIFSSTHIMNTSTRKNDLRSVFSRAFTPSNPSQTFFSSNKPYHWLVTEMSAFGVFLIVLLISRNICFHRSNRPHFIVQSGPNQSEGEAKLAISSKIAENCVGNILLQTDKKNFI